MKLNIVFLTILFFVSCEEIDHTSHILSVKNRTSTELSVVFQTNEMQSLETKRLGTDVTDGVELGSIVEKGDQNWLDEDEIFDFFKTFLIISGSDTVITSAAGGQWTQLNGGIDTSGRSRGYLLEINQEDLD